MKKEHQRVHQIGTSEKTFDTTDGADASTFLGTLASEVHSVSTYAKRIYVFVRLNDKLKMKLKVDAGADICAINIDDLQDFPFPVEIKKDDSILK